MQEKIQSINGSDLFTVSNQLESKQSVLIVHGYAEHIMRYEGFMNQLTNAGFSVKGYDCKGHGKSSGKRAIISSFDAYVDDLHAIASDFFKDGENNFIYGHSMGGLVLMLYLQKYGSSNLTGVIVSGPGMKTYDKTPFLLELVAPLIAAIIPSFPAASVDGSTVSRDTEEVRKYNEDPLNYRGKTKAKMGYEFLQAQKKAIPNLSKINVPIMINHGSEDRLIHPESSDIIYNGISSTDKTLRIWEGLYHELLNEPEKIQVGEEFIDWMKARIK